MTNNGIYSFIFYKYITKEINTRGTLRGIGISRLAKISTLFREWLRPFN